MPVYPTPGRGVSTAGIDKDEGWGSRNATNQVIAGHQGDQGIDHTAGLVEAGLDIATNPRISAQSVTPIAATTATVLWTTPIASPPGTVTRRVAGTTAWLGPITESAGNKTAHSAALTGLVTLTTYEYRIVQPSLTAGAPPTEAMGGFRTT